MCEDEAGVGGRLRLAHWQGPHSFRGGGGRGTRSLGRGRARREAEGGGGQNSGRQTKLSPAVRGAERSVSSWSPKMGTIRWAVEDELEPFKVGRLWAEERGNREKPGGCSWDVWPQAE